MLKSNSTIKYKTEEYDFNKMTREQVKQILKNYYTIDLTKTNKNNVDYLLRNRMLGTKKIIINNENFNVETYFAAFNGYKEDIYIIKDEFNNEYTVNMYSIIFDNKEVPLKRINAGFFESQEVRKELIDKLLYCEKEVGEYFTIQGEYYFVSKKLVYKQFETLVLEYETYNKFGFMTTVIFRKLEVDDKYIMQIIYNRN